jgi:hypothetical protein
MVRRYSAIDALDGIASIGTDADQRLLWLGDFVSRDLGDREAKERAARELALVPFAGGGAVQLDIRTLPGPEDAQAVQAAVRDVLRGLAAGGSVWLHEPPFDPSISVGNGLIWREGRGVVLATRGSGVSLVLAAVVDVLMAVGPRLARCVTPSCRRLFAIRRKGQTHCVKTCGSGDRVREWRKKNPGRESEKKHRQYTRRVQRRLGARVRPVRRPRKA